MYDLCVRIREPFVAEGNLMKIMMVETDHDYQRVNIIEFKETDIGEGDFASDYFSNNFKLLERRE